MNLASLRSVALPAAVLLGLSSASVHAVTFTENFNSYTASSTPVTGLTASPGFGGATGGWLTGWRISPTSAAGSARVLDTAPLRSGGNYFSTSVSAAAATGATDAIAISRAYDVTGNSLATASAIYVNFDFRADAFTPATMSFDLSDNAARSTVGNSGSSWEIRSINGFWNVYSSSNPIPTTMAVTAGTTYSFSIVMNPVTKKWDYSIGNGSSSVSGSALNFRGAAFATDTTPGSVGGRWFTVGALEAVDTASQAATFSIDNISISTTSPIPEPSTFALLGGAVALAAAASRRRR